MISRFVILVLVAIALAACAPSAALVDTSTPVPRRAATQTSPPPTPTPTVTATSSPPSPTPTFTVTDTPTATPRPAQLLLPDAAVVYSPAALDFDVAAYLEDRGGYLSDYEQYLMITGWTSAAEIIQRVAIENSISPRLLLALLEYQSGCVLGLPDDPENFDTALGASTYYRKDLYGQLIWAAHALSEGFYQRRAGALSQLSFSDGTIRPLPADLNPGSAALTHFFAQLVSPEEHARTLAAFQARYLEMFADPWERAASLDDLVPADLTQPAWSLPFEHGETWAYTGGPHPAFEQNGPRAALDFAPQMAVSGCEPSGKWVVAVADGLVVRSEFGVVVQDLDGDGYEQTGWNIMYLHIGSEDRVPVGTELQAGDAVGHPSCEGGRATGTHLHIARKYNGVWMAADGPIPFVLDGWTAHNGDDNYLGTLTRGGDTVIASQVGTATSLVTRAERSQ